MCGLAPSRLLGQLNFGAGGWEHATVRVLPTGMVEVVTGTSPHGQGHETCWSMITADRLGVPPDHVEVLHSDTAISHLGLDTYGSRSLSVGGMAVYSACDKVIEKARVDRRAPAWRSPRRTSSSSTASSACVGTPSTASRSRRRRSTAFTAHNLPEGMEPNLTSDASYDPTNFTFPFGAHIAVVEIDGETGSVELLRYVAVDDCGNQINPLIVEGQVQGGIVQGIAQALWEEARFDERGNLRTASLDRLPRTVGGGGAEHGARLHGHAQPDHRDGRQGHRRSRDHRGHARGDERGDRRARRRSASPTSTCRRRRNGCGPRCTEAAR